MNVNFAIIGIAGMLVLSLQYFVFIWVPTDSVLGVSQRIFYYHVPLAWVGFLAFGAVFIASIAYLFTKQSRWDSLGHAAAETGILFMSAALLTGMIWSKPVWGVWWTWAPQQTTTLILWLIYVSYLMLRGYGPAGDQGAKYAAVLGIIGFFDVPIVYMAGKWWRDIHPQAVVGPLAENGSLETSMLITLVIGVFAFTGLFAVLLPYRYKLRRQQILLAQLRNYYD